MEFRAKLKQFLERIEFMKNTVQTEEATKMSLVVPLFHLLGYDVFNSTEFCPEYTADVGIKKGEKVDYAILVKGSPIVLIEAKSVDKNLDKYSSQLFRYFVTTPAKFAILTNGVIYKIYTDLDEPNKMDKEPFLEINLLDIKEYQIEQLAKFQKDCFSISEILNNASVLKYNNLFKKYADKQFQNPDDDLVKLFLQSLYKGAKTQTVIEKFRPIVKQALHDFIEESTAKQLQTVLGETNRLFPSTASESIRAEERDAFTLVKDILKNTVDINKVSHKQTESYFAILYENNTRKWICRIIIGSSQNILILPDENKKEIRHALTSIHDIGNYSHHFKKIACRYLPLPQQTQPLLHTKWGIYETPTPYLVDLTQGPRSSLTPVTEKPLSQASELLTP